MFAKYNYPQSYYYIDRDFQLELNLQSIRRDLVLLLEATSPSPSVSSSDSAWSSDSSSEDDLLGTAPPPHTLPIPQWHQIIDQEDFYRGLEAWIRASTPYPIPYFLPGDVPRFPLSKNLECPIHCSWPPLPGSLWDEGTLQKTLMREIEYKKGVISVMEFFKHFRERQVPGNRGKGFKDGRLGKTEYTYF